MKTSVIYNYSRKLCISVEYFVEWLSNQNPPWDSYQEFVSGRLIALDKLPGVRPVGVGETWRCLFSKCILEVTIYEATNTCRYDHLCAGLKAGINMVLHWVKYILEAYPTE